MADIFISYSNSDRLRAKALAEAIEAHGWVVWWDRKIPLGRSWDQVIEEQVDAARCMIVLWSKESVLSSWVKTEAREGKARGILIPVLTDEVKIPLEFRHLQAANLTDWEPAEQNAEFDQLLTHVGQMLAPRSVVKPQSQGVTLSAAEQSAPDNMAERASDPTRETPFTKTDPTPLNNESAADSLASPEILPATMNLLHTLGGMGPVCSLVYSPAGTTLTVLWGDRSAQIWRVSDGKLLTTLHGEGQDAWTATGGVAFSPDGTLLATTPEPNTALLWQVSDGKLLRMLKGHTALINALAFSPAGGVLASASDDKTVRLWGAQDGKLLGTMQENTQWIRCIAFSPDGELLASGAQVIISAPELKIWQASDGKLLRSLAGHTDTIYSVAFSPDGNTLASASHDHTVRVWQVSDGKLLRTLTGHSEIVVSLAFSADGALLASGSDDKTVRIWSGEDGKLLQTLAGHGARVTCLAFSRDGETLASGSSDHTVRIWSSK